MFEQLSALLAGYFHQDWDLEFPNYSAVANHFVGEADTATVETVLGQLAILAASENEVQINEILTAAGCYFRPVDGSLSDWLKDFALQISRAAWKQRNDVG